MLMGPSCSENVSVSKMRERHTGLNKIRPQTEPVIHKVTHFLMAI